MKPICLLLLLFIALSCSSSSKEKQSSQPVKQETIHPLKVGAEQVDKWTQSLNNRNIALVVNHTSFIKDEHLVDFMLKRNLKIERIFAPEHGFRGNADAGEHIKSNIDAKTGISVVSIYGKNKKPSAEQLKGIDVVVFDIQDVGCRFYTYISSMHYVMEACAENKIPMVVFDRPNPNGNLVEGPVLDLKFRSFVGVDPIPVVHGCTVGELANMMNNEGWLKGGVKADLTVVPCQNYKHSDTYILPIKPSPNLPNQTSIYLYPYLCFFEATSVSVGRGTQFPFQVLGYPKEGMGDFSFTPISIEGMAKNPMYKDKVCYGMDLRNAKTMPNSLLYYFDEWAKKFDNFDEYVTRRRWFNLLIGNDWVLPMIEKGKSLEEIESLWQDDLNAFLALRKKYLLYLEK